MKAEVVVKASKNQLFVDAEVEKNTFITDTVKPYETKRYPILKGITIKELK